MKISSLIFLIIIIFSFSTSALAAPEAASYKINGKQESARFNPSVADSKVSIEINANVPVKFNTIAICSAGDIVCSRTTAVKYFTQTADFSLSVSKDWDGRTSKGAAVSDGDYKIKITMKDESGAENTQELSPYIITADSNFSGDSGGNSSASSETFSSQAPSASSGTQNSESSFFISTHSSPEDLSSSSKSSARFEASSGRDRLAYSGAPVIFSGEAVIPKNLEEQSVKFVWSFGDGSVAEGKKVSHIYKFAGDYIVVLNTSMSDLSAVSRTSAKVVNPSVVIANISGDSVEVWNKGIYEINLDGWIISNDRFKFIFPTDTIIGPNKKIAFPDEYMKLNLSQSGKISLLNPSQREISELTYGGEASSSSPTLAVNFSDFDNDPVVKKIREFIAKGNRSSTGGNLAPITKNSLSSQVGKASFIASEKTIVTNNKAPISEHSEVISSSTQTASALLNQVQSRGFLRGLLSLPSSGLGFIKRMFYSGN